MRNCNKHIGGPDSRPIYCNQCLDEKTDAAVNKKMREVRDAVEKYRDVQEANADGLFYAGAIEALSSVLATFGPGGEFEVKE